MLPDCSFSIRPAAAADIPALYEIWYQLEVAGAGDPPPRAVPVALEHELAYGTIALAERDGEPLGFAATIARGAVVFLSECFVRADRQSGGVGRALVRQLLPDDGRLRCTLGSNDPRALALYIRAGMRPHWPNFCLLADTARLSDPPDPGLEVAPGEPGDPELVEWDAAIGGRHRPEDHAFWVRELAATPLWFRRGAATVGYGYAQMRSPEAIWTPDALMLGPIGARTPADAAACALAALRWARPRAAIVRVNLPGPHPALAALLDCGFQITYVETFVAASEQLFADMRCYLSSGSTLF